MSRDDQFKGFAKAVFVDLEPMFSNLVSERDDCDPEAKRTAEGIKEVIAECAYDLVLHVLATLEPASFDRYESSRKDEIAATIPDMPMLPEETKKEKLDIPKVVADWLNNGGMDRLTRSKAQQPVMQPVMQPIRYIPKPLPELPQLPKLPVEREQIDERKHRG